jgi:YegS/Rv2252/BmrU family lipid kinase
VAQKSTIHPDVYVVANARSGTGNDDAFRERLVRLFDQHGMSAEVKLACGDELARFAKEAAVGPARIVAACGGDGTVNLVVNAIAGRDKVLGILPEGTLNHFAKDLGIPLDLDDAVEVVCARHEQSVDVGEVNGHLFVNNSSVGLYPRIVRHREQQQHLGRGKWAAFVWACLSVLRRFPFFHVRLTVDGQPLETRTPLVFIGNNPYEMEGLRIGARTTLTDGLLSIYLTKRIGRWGLFVLALRALFGRLRLAREFLSFTAKEMEIETRKHRVQVALDGEVMVMATPLRYRIRAGELRVMAPRPEGIEA